MAESGTLLRMVPLKNTSSPARMHHGDKLGKTITVSGFRKLRAAEITRKIKRRGLPMCRLMAARGGLLARRSVLVAGLAASALLSGLSGSRAAEPGITDTAIKVGVLGSLTGPPSDPPKVQ